MRTIAEYAAIEPKTLEEAQHKLTLIGIIACETMVDINTEDVVNVDEREVMVMGFRRPGS